jgi:hypothetical protein
MYDSFGDGWDKTVVTIAESKNKNRQIFNGGLVTGSQGTAFICLSKNPTCYNVDTSGGVWGVEVSWEVKSMNEGPPTGE